MWVTSRDSKAEPGSVIAAVLDFSPLSGPVAWNLKLFVEGCILSLLSVFLIRFIGAAEAGLLGIALASAAMTPRLNRVLEINRERIWSEEGSGPSANRTSLFSGLSIFLGMFVAFLVVGIVTDDIRLYKDFSFIIQQTRVDPDAILSPDRFSQGMTIFGHNILVLISFGVLGFFYRSLGTMIALGWNAGVWGITIVLFMGGGSRCRSTGGHRCWRWYTESGGDFHNHVASSVHDNACCVLVAGVYASPVHGPAHRVGIGA